MGTLGEDIVNPGYIFKKLVLKISRKNPSIKSKQKIRNIKKLSMLQTSTIGGLRKVTFSSTTGGLRKVTLLNQIKIEATSNDYVDKKTKSK